MPRDQRFPGGATFESSERGHRAKARGCNRARGLARPCRNLRRPVGEQWWRRSVTDPLSNVTTYGYDGSGRLTSVTDANSKVTSFTVNGTGGVTAVTDRLATPRASATTASPGTSRTA